MIAQQCSNCSWSCYPVVMLLWYSSSGERSPLLLPTNCSCLKLCTWSWVHPSGSQTSE